MICPNCEQLRCELGNRLERHFCEFEIDDDFSHLSSQLVIESVAYDDVGAVDINDDRSEENGSGEKGEDTDEGRE